MKRAMMMMTNGAVRVVVVVAVGRVNVGVGRAARKGSAAAACLSCGRGRNDSAGWRGDDARVCQKKERPGERVRARVGA